eukprot:2719405-Rhodomonas_salina.2
MHRALSSASGRLPARSRGQHVHQRVARDEDVLRVQVPEVCLDVPRDPVRHAWRALHVQPMVLRSQAEEKTKERKKSDPRRAEQGKRRKKREGKTGGGQDGGGGAG